MPPKIVAPSLGPSTNNSPSPGFGRSKLRGPRKEEIPDGRSLREATKQIQEDRQQAGFNKLFAKHPPNLDHLAASLRKDHDPKDVTTVIVAIRHMLQQIKKSPKYCLHRFHRLLGAVSVIRKAYFQSRMRFVIRIVTLSERWANLERNAPRRHGPVSRTAIAAALDEKWDLTSNALAGGGGHSSLMSTLRGSSGEKWEPHMCPLMIKRSVLLSQYKRMMEEFLKRWHLYKIHVAQQQNAKLHQRQPRRPVTVSTELGGSRIAFVPVESVFSPSAGKHNDFDDSTSGRNGNNNHQAQSVVAASASALKDSYYHKPVFAQRTSAKEKDPNEPRFPWYTILHSLNLQQLIDLTLRTHKHEERLARIAASDAESVAMGIGQHDPRRMSTTSSIPKNEAESFDTDVMTNGVDEYCNGVERDWVEYGHEMEARISSAASAPRKRNKNKSPSRSPKRKSNSPPRRSLLQSLSSNVGKRNVKNNSSNNNNNVDARRASTPSFGANNNNNNSNNMSNVQNISSISTIQQHATSSSTPTPNRKILLPPMSPSDNSNKASSTTPAKLHKSSIHRNGAKNGDDDSFSLASDSSSDSEAAEYYDDLGIKRKKGESRNEISATAHSKKKRRNQELTAPQKMADMKSMGVLSKFFNWEERPRVSVPVRITVSSKYHEKLLKARTREIEKGKSCGQNVVTDHLCLHQLEPFREMDHFTRSLFMRGIRQPLPSQTDRGATHERAKIMSKASRELATAQELDQIIAVVDPPPMKFAMH